MVLKSTWEKGGEGQKKNFKGMKFKDFHRVFLRFCQRLFQKKFKDFLMIFLKDFFQRSLQGFF